MSSIYDNEKYLYAENLKNKQVKLKIKKIVMGAKFHSPAGTQEGFDIHFEGTDKVLGVAGITVKRQLFVATGEEDPEKMTGKDITLYPIKSKKSATGQAIRIKIPEQHA